MPKVVAEMHSMPHFIIVRILFDLKMKFIGLTLISVLPSISEKSSTYFLLIRIQSGLSLYH